MKKIITSVGMIVFAVAIVASGTGAFFSDTETSTANVFTAGAIDLQIDNSSYGFDWNDPNNENPEGVWGENTNNSWELSDLTNEIFFNFHDLKPGDYGEDTISIHVDNNDAYACMAFDLTGTPENGQNEPEAKVDETAGEDEGELQNYLSFLFWHDDGDNVLEEGEELISSLNGLSSDIFTGNWLALAESGDEPFAGGQTSYIGKGWCFGDIAEDPLDQDGSGDQRVPEAGATGFTCTGAEGDHNDAQTDGINVDVAFHAVQARHNENFSCASLPPMDGSGDNGDDNGDDQRELVGASLDDYVAPSAQECDVTVAEGESIQDAIDNASSTATICVGSGSFTEDVNVNKSLTLSGDGATNTTTLTGEGTGEAGALVISADDVIVEGFNVIGTGVSAIRISGARDNVTVRYNHVTAATGKNAFLADGGQSNHIISNNVFDGDSSQLAYVNGTASVNIASENVDFTENTFEGSGNMALGQEANNSSVTQNVFSTATSFTDVEDWGAGNNYNQNNFNDGGLNLQHSENVNTGDNGITDAENNWWGDIDPSDGDVNSNADVDFDPFEASAFPLN